MQIDHGISTKMQAHEFVLKVAAEIVRASSEKDTIRFLELSQQLHATFDAVIQVTSQAAVEQTCRPFIEAVAEQDLIFTARGEEAFKAMRAAAGTPDQD